MNQKSLQGNVKLLSHEKWQELIPPSGYNVFLPATLAPNYRLFMSKCRDRRNNSLDWTFRLNNISTPIERSTTMYKEEKKKDLCPYLSLCDMFKTCEPRNTSCHVITYLEPPLLTKPFNLTPNTPLPMCEWNVFEERDYHTGLIKTVIQVNNVSIKFQQDAHFSVLKCSLKDWLRHSNHHLAFNLEEKNSFFSNCYLMYTKESPCTHLFLKHYAIYIEERIPMKLCVDIEEN